MTKIRAIFEGREVFGTHTDRGLVSLYDNQGKKRRAYKSTFRFPGREIDSYVAEDEVIKSGDVAAYRHADAESAIERHGYTGLEVMP